jgi:hypothetical protein
MITLNLIQMGLATDNTSGGWRHVWWIADNWFTAVFLLEAVIKVMAFRAEYFCHPKDGKWNSFDASIVLLSVMDTWVISIFLNPSDEGTSFSPIRLFRMLRLLRMVKMFRMIPDLMMVIIGIASSLRALFWVFCLMTLVLYVFAIVCVQVIGGADSGYPGYNPNEDLIKSSYNQWNNHLHFGSLTRALMSLSNMVLLAEWPTTVWPVWEYQGPVVLIFIVLVVVTTFGIMNVIIGVIVDHTNKAMVELNMAKILEKREAQMASLQALVSLVCLMDEDGTGDLSLEEFEKAADENPDFMKYLSQVDFPYGFTYEDLHHMLDKDADGVVTEEEFVDAMFRIVHGNEFHHNCLLHVNFGEIKLLLKEVLRNQETAKTDIREVQMEAIREVVRSETDRACAGVLEQLRSLQEQIGQLGALNMVANRSSFAVGATSSQGHVASASVEGWPQDFVKPETKVADAAFARVLESKEEKMPAVKSSSAGTRMMPCLGKCGTIYHTPRGNMENQQIMQQTVQKHVNQASADVKLEIQALRDQLLALPPMPMAADAANQPSRWKPAPLTLPPGAISGLAHTVLESVPENKQDTRESFDG